MTDFVLEAKQLVNLEIEAQDAKWGVQDHEPCEWIAILAEEVGEAAKEALEVRFAGPSGYAGPDGEYVTHAQVLEKLREAARRYRDELIQSAAVAVQAAACIDRQMGAVQ